MPRSKVLFFASAGMVALSATPALGADEQPGPALEEIVVTANRTESLLSDTPIAMTAITGKDLVQSGITNPTHLADWVPNLSIVRNNGLQITIRGVTSADYTEKGDPSAAFMLNGIYIARPQAQEVSFFDVERVEVLRGPQGTLYGRNATAGVVNVISTRPKMEFGGSVDASYGSFDDINTTAVVNLPVGETFAVRAAANFDQRDSFIIDGNSSDGVTLDPFKKNTSLRLSTLFRPNEDFDLLVIGDYSKMKGVGFYTMPTTNFYSDIVTGARPTFETATFRHRSSKAYRTYSNPMGQQPRLDNDDKGIMAEANYSLGFAKLTYLGSYREFDRGEYQNVNATGINSDFFGHYGQTSHELRLALTGDGALQAQVGGYYFREHSGLVLNLYNLLGPNTGYQFLRDPTVSENKSVFGQATYEIVPSLKLTGGLRYSRDTKSRFGQTAVNQFTSVTSSYDIGTLLNSTVLENTAANRTFSKVTWRAGIDYDSPLGLIFASVSTGYKAGGFNDGCEAGKGPGCTLTANALYYNPETLTAYEAGFKFHLTPQLHLNGTVFHYDYKDLQLSQVLNICGPNQDVPCGVTRNAATAKVDGVELDAQLKPTNQFLASLGVNYLDARYTNFIPVTGIDFSGRQLDRSPKWTWLANITYWVPLGNGKLEANASTRYSSRYELTDQGNYAYFYQPHYTKTDLSLTYSAPDERFYVGAFVKNLENEVVVTTASAGFFGFVTFADPRQYGMRAGLKF